MTDKILSLLAFCAMVAGPFVKTYLVGGFSQDLQLTYITVFFFLQFLIPLCNFGLVWQYTRTYIEHEIEYPFQLSLITLGVVVLATIIDPLWGMVGILAISYACWTYFLQIRRLAGQKYLFMISRIAKVCIDVTLLAMILQSSITLTVAWIIGLELTAVTMVIAVLALRYGLRIKLAHTLWAGLNRHFFFAIIRVSEANYMRLGLLFLFPQEKFVQIFFILVGYEYICQFANLNFIRSFLHDAKALQNLLIFVVTTLPLQAGLIWVIGQVYDWNLGVLEMAVIMAQGSMMILLLMFVRVVREGDADKYALYLALNILLGLVFMGSAWILGVSGVKVYLVMVTPKVIEVTLLMWHLKSYEV